MGVLQFNGTSDHVRWTTLAAALQNVSDGAFTCAALVRGVGMTVGADFDAIAYLLSGTGNGVVEAGLSFDAADQLVCDNGTTAPSSGTSLVDATTYIVVTKKAAGTVRVTYDWFPFGGAWSHAAPGGGNTTPDQTAATMLEIGSWQNGSDLFDGYIGLVGFWEGDMTNLQTEALSTNWRTSDWWTHAFGQPKFLCELNVAGSSLTDLAGNASALTATGTTLDGAQTLNSWNFNGTGGGGATSTKAGSGIIGP